VKVERDLQAVFAAHSAVSFDLPLGRNFGRHLVAFHAETEAQSDVTGTYQNKLPD
jgi:hypothetical protein